jgi:long-chain fatty acid transport protein
MRRVILCFLLLALLVWPARTRAGGFELMEQSPAGVATAGAQAASVEDATAVQYNPAGLTFFRGLSLVGGGAAWVGSFDADNTRGSGALGLPMVFVADRLGPYVGIGVGVSSQFATQVQWPEGWPGSPLAIAFGVRTTTINPSVALRPFPRVAIGFGLSVVPATFLWQHSTPTGRIDAEMTAVGLGGNVGVMATLVPRYLTFGATYRSAVDLDFGGDGDIQRIGAPVIAQRANLALPLPHNMTFAFSSHPVAALTLAVDVHVTLWSDLGALDLRLIDRDAPDEAKPVSDVRELSLRESVGVRVGGEYRLLDERLRVRLGLGYDTTPVKRGWLGPLLPDNQRVTVGVGIAYRHGAIGIDAGYSVGIGLSRLSTEPALAATYTSLQHLVAVALVIHLKDFGVRVDLPDYRH